MQLKTNRLVFSFEKWHKNTQKMYALETCKKQDKIKLFYGYIKNSLFHNIGN